MPRPSQSRAAEPRGHLIVPEYLGRRARQDIVGWLAHLRPIWEFRYSTEREPPRGETQRRLLRPVYWLGNWQFACLDYYRPPKGVLGRAVQAEPFPRVLAEIVKDIEARTRRAFVREDVPNGWHLNTCLVNFYGDRLEGGRWVDSARVGEHRDFEPGPVASLSLGERALFQFVPRRGAGERAEPVLSQWLDDGSLQLFAGKNFKERLLHRVQRVDRRAGANLPPLMDDFRTRRVNFTFRYVPDEHVIPFAELPAEAQADVRPYVTELSEHSEFFRRALGSKGARENS
ncbi:MAG TPA: alpha-ketoglutarate-dependent dioxygenase AlkB [Polyangiaceae bacterium]|jgi:alkylated DNA repair dioxygenase AlkB|nr:alpha-ketoglutarate-dependent dioxygenase AlkB [Polyangiaceae bacterium]